MKSPLRLCALVVGACGLLCPASWAQTPAPTATKVVLRALYVAEGMSVDGRLDESVYAETPPVTELIQQEPQEGMPATEKTEVWVFFDSRNLYVCARMWDSHPERMIANEMRRDASQDIYANENCMTALGGLSGGA